MAKIRGVFDEVHLQSSFNKLAKKENGRVYGKDFKHRKETIYKIYITSICLCICMQIFTSF